MIESHLRYLTAINICADLIPQVFVLDAKLSENLPTVNLNPPKISLKLLSVKVNLRERKTIRKMKMDAKI